MRRHLGWIIPIVLLPAIYFGLVIVAILISSWVNSAPDQAGWAVLVGAIASVAALAGGVVCVVQAIRNGWRAFRAFRRRHGHFTKGELATREVQLDHQRSWDAAQGLLDDVRNQRLPPAIEVWGVIPRPDEQFFFDVDAQYERFYGTAAEYTQRWGSYLGRPSFVMAGLAIDAISNAASRSAGMRAAAAQWREQQRSRILVSNQRIVVQANGQWLSFDYAAMSACYPDPEHWCVAFEFSSTQPMRLVGRSAPIIAVWTVLATHGRHAIEQHPALTSLR